MPRQKKISFSLSGLSEIELWILRLAGILLLAITLLGIIVEKFAWLVKLIKDIKA